MMTEMKTVITGGGYRLERTCRDLTVEGNGLYLDLSDDYMNVYIH